jgi:hypothetical protein
MHGHPPAANPIASDSERRSDYGFAYFHYIPVAQVTEWQSLGWKIVDKLEDTHHGRYSVLGRWEGSGEPIMARAFSSAQKNISALA